MYGILSGAYNTVAGLGMAAYNNELAREQQAHYIGLNYHYNEMAAQNADTRTRRLYHSFYSPEALMKQYQAAGLSPSMMFGGTPGQGGMSGAQGAGAAGPVGATYGVSILEAAQAANLMAQTDKTRAETDQIEGKNERGRLELEGLVNENALTKAKELQTKVETDIEQINLEINEATKEDQIKTIEANTTKAMEEVVNLLYTIKTNAADAEVAEKTVQSRIKYAAEEAVGKEITNNLERKKLQNYLRELNVLIKKAKTEVNLNIETKKWMEGYFRNAQRMTRFHENKQQMDNKREYIKIFLNFIGGIGGKAAAFL